jgi:small-conductance mechanosensitive channel
VEAFNRTAPVPEFSDSFLEWLMAVGITAAWFVTLLIVRRLIRAYDARLKLKPDADLWAVATSTLGRTSVLFILVLSAEAGLATLTPSGTIARFARSIVMIALIWQVGIWSTAATGAFLERRKQRMIEADRATAGSLSIVGIIARMAIWTVVVLLILENAGVDVTALVAGLGIGGVAVALAMQNILGDLFASLSITFDHPFVLGDLLLIEGYSGRVEHIGLKSTRLRGMAGEQIILSNADLLRSRVRNYGSLAERRVEFTLGIAYGTAPGTLERIPAMIAGIVTAQEGARFDRSHFAKHGTWSLDFETVYYVLSPDLRRHMDIQQNIHLRIHRDFARAGIEFAVPPGSIAVAS